MDEVHQWQGVVLLDLDLGLLLDHRGLVELLYILHIRVGERDVVAVDQLEGHELGACRRQCEAGVLG